MQQHSQQISQQGSVLIISLVIMVVLTILGVSGMKTTILEEKMAGNMRDSQLAFQAAEATLKQAEQYIEQNVVSISSFDNDGSGAITSLRRILKGLAVKEVQAPVLIAGEFDESRLSDCEELGLTMAAALEAGVV